MRTTSTSPVRFLPVPLLHADRYEIDTDFAKVRTHGMEDPVDYARRRSGSAARAVVAPNVVEANQHSIDILFEPSGEGIEEVIAASWPTMLCAFAAAATHGRNGYKVRIKVEARDKAILDARFFVAFSLSRGSRASPCIGSST